MLNHTKDPPAITVRCISPYDDYVPSFYRTFRCDATNVYDALKEEFRYWTSRDPTIIEAPPGLGKTTFIYKAIIPRARELGKNVLLLSNRVALSTQQKEDVMRIIDSPLQGCLTSKGIREAENFGPVRIITYHRLPTLLKDPSNAAWLKNLMYVVADEVHFFSADSSFNERCEYYLQLLTAKFQHAVRIYLTATSWDILVPLAEAEQKNYRDFSLLTDPLVFSREFRRYCFPANYQHVKLQFFTDLSEIDQMVSETPDEKWLVFVDSISQGKAFAKKLGTKVSYIDSSSKETDTWVQLLQDHTFKTQVLVTTAVLDCGVNIIDERLRNIVIVTDNRTSFIQMLGRKRILSDEQINLYVCKPDPRSLGERYAQATRLMTWYDRYLQSTSKERRSMAYEIWNNDDPRIRKYFHLTGCQLKPNTLAFYVLGRQIKFYKSLSNPDLDFPMAVYSWLGQPPAEEAENLQKQLLYYCREHENTILSEEELRAFRRLVIAAAIQHGFREPHADRLESLGREAINNRLHFVQCGYMVTKDQQLIRTVQD